MKTFTTALAFSSLSFALNSCGTVADVQSSVQKGVQSVQAGVTNTGKSLKKRGGSLSSSLAALTGPNIKVVQVDPSKLKTLESGQERLAAYKAEKRRRERAMQAARSARSTRITLPEINDPEYYSIEGFEPGAGMLPSKPGS